jgi:K+ transporter
VLSAVEGLKVITPSLGEFVLPVTVIVAGALVVLRPRSSVARAVTV